MPRVVLRPQWHPRKVVTVVASALAISLLVRSPNTIGSRTQVVENSLSEVEAFVEAFSRSPCKHRIRALGKGLAGLRCKPYAGAALQEGIGPIPMGPRATLSSVMPWSFTA